MERGFIQAGMNGLWGLEEELSGLFKPVIPDPEFVGALKLKLTQTPAVFLETKKRRLGVLIIAAGLLTGTLFIWLWNKRTLVLSSQDQVN